MNAEAIKSLTHAQKVELFTLLDEKDRRRLDHPITEWFTDKGPAARKGYPKHIEYFRLGADRRVRGFVGANRVGKSTAGACESYWHATGRYPDWWSGKRFETRVTGWLCGETTEVVRDTLQKKLLGPPDNLGSGIIPREVMAKCKITYRQNTNGAADTIAIPHVSGGMSRLTFKSYDMGRAKFQGAELDLAWLDEEPRDIGIYTETLTRTATTNGIVMLTFTALRGLTSLVLRFMPEFAGTEAASVDDGASRAVVICGWDDVPHMDAAMQRELIAEYQPHEIQPRTTGVPSVGSGSIYPIPESEIVMKPFDLPAHWPRVAALDPGLTRTAALWGALDRTSDVVYLYSEHYRGQAELEVHAAALRARGTWIPFVSDESVSAHDGSSIIDKYQNMGILARKAQKHDKEGRIFEVYSRLSSGRLKVFNTLQNFLFEYRMYRRDDKGRIVKENDHLMDCCAMLCQSGLPIARTRIERDNAPRMQEQTFGIYGAA